MRNIVLTCAVIIVSAACSGGDAPATTTTSTSTSPSTSSSVDTDLPPRTGVVHTIEMIMDDDGNYYKPAEIDAKPGDVLSFVLVSGVHNVHFPADSNPGVKGLPPMGPMLQLPGQKDDVVVPDAVGKRLFFQCDPHALLNMVGWVNVVEP